MTMPGPKHRYTGLAQSPYFKMVDGNSTIKLPCSKTNNLITQGSLSFVSWSKKSSY